MINKLLEKVPKQNHNRYLFEQELEYIVDYFEKNKCECYVKEVNGKDYLAIKKDEKVYYVRLKIDVTYLTKYEFVIFRYSLEGNIIEAFRTKEVTIIKDKDIHYLILEIEKKLSEERHLEWIKNNYPGKERPIDCELEVYNNILKENGFTTILVEEEILKGVHEILFFTKDKPNLVEPSVVFALWRKNNKLIVSSVIYINFKLDAESFYEYDEIRNFSIEQIENLLI